MQLKERKFYPKFKGYVKGGNLYFSDRKSFDRYIYGNLEGKAVDIVVKPQTKDRSRQEEKFYHAVVVASVAEVICIPNEEAHQFLKSLFLRREERTPQGFRYERTLSTTELSDKAYREYWEECIRWAALPTKDEGLAFDSGLELFIPYPNEVDYQNY